MVSITFTSMVTFYYIHGCYYIYGFYYIYGWYISNSKEGHNTQRYFPVSKTTSNDNCEKIPSWVSFSRLPYMSIKDSASDGTLGLSFEIQMGVLGHSFWDSGGLVS